MIQFGVNILLACLVLSVDMSKDKHGHFYASLLLMAAVIGLSLVGLLGMGTGGVR